MKPSKVGLVKHTPELDVDIGNLKKTVWFLTHIRPSRNYKHIHTLEKVASYIRQQFSQVGLSVEMQPFHVENMTYTNVIGTYGNEKQERIIIGAHYDVCGDQPGADDNASAVAGLLEIARQISLHGSHSPYRFDFVAYTLEEPPFFLTEEMGSYIHAHTLAQHAIPVRGMICLEMIGYFTTARHSQTYPIELLNAIYPTIGEFIDVVEKIGTVGDFIAVIGKQGSERLLSTLRRYLGMTTLPVKLWSIPPEFATRLELSDHMNYWKCGYEAVIITDTADYRNPHYHQPSDTMNTLDFDKIGEVVKGITWALLNIP